MNIHWRRYLTILAVTGAPFWAGALVSAGAGGRLGWHWLLTAIASFACGFGTFLVLAILRDIRCYLRNPPVNRRQGT